MKKIILFGVVLAVSLIGFALSLYVLTVTYQAQSATGNMSEMMRQMMGGGMIGGQEGMDVPATAEVPFYLWILPLVFISLLILGVGGMLYFFAVPEIRITPQPVGEPSVRPSEAAPDLRGEKVSTLLNTMKPEERRVFEVLESHGGKYLQKHISKEADLSRLKTHRIVARFAERGIVTVRPFGNTNEVTISDWLTSKE